MRKTFRLRLAATYLILIIIIVVILGIALFNIFKDYYTKNVESSLINEAHLIGQMINTSAQVPGDINLQKLADTGGKETKTRVTIIGQNGVVLADSVYDPAKLGLHNTRPEVYQALNGKTGVEVRYSNTVKTKMIYVAMPFTNTKVTGVIRLSTSLLAVEEMYSRMWSMLLLAIVICGLLAFAVSLIFAEKVSRPIRDVTAAVREIAKGNLHKRIFYNEDDELGEMAQTFNGMAEYLENNTIEISEVKNRLETLLENTVNGIVMVDRSARITYTNPVAVKLLGDSIKVQGKKHVEAITNYELVETIDVVRRQLEPIHKEIVLHALGDRVIDVNVVPLKANTFSGQGVLVVLNDITDLKKLEQMRKDFVANVSHELKTPIATISGFAETLVEEGQKSENVTEFARIIYDEARRLSRLISRLLDLSRLESQNYTIQKIAFNMSQLIEDAIKTMQPEIQGKHINIAFRYDAPINIEGDPDVVAQIMMNLMDNAVKFSHDGDTVHIDLKEQQGQVQIIVKDEGIGIPTDELGRIFERFYRVDKARCRKTGGTGLGLAIVKHLVENHGGQIEVKSTEGKGSIFTVTLPSI